MAFNITEKDIDEGIAQAKKDPAFLDELLELIGPYKQKMHDRELASQLVLKISEVIPELIYPKWSVFIDYLKAKNAFSRYVAHTVITNLIVFDNQNFIDQDLDKYLRIIHDESVMVCMHSIENFAKLIDYRPDLEQITTTELLEIDSDLFHHKHKELIKGSVIKTFKEYFDKSQFQQEMIGFAKNNINSSSGKTKKLAKEFLKKNS